MHAGFECIVRVGSLSSSFQPSRCQRSAGPAEPELPDNPIKVQLGQRFGSYRLLPAVIQVALKQTVPSVTEVFYMLDIKVRRKSSVNIQHRLFVRDECGTHGCLSLSTSRLQ